MGFLIGTVLTLFVLNAIFLVFLVVVFQTKGGGSAMGMLGGSSQTPFGSSGTDVITKVTRYAAISFIVFSLFLSFLFAKKQETILPPEGSIIPDAKTETLPVTPEKK
jgi:preprotein translocase subunit SecG